MKRLLIVLGALTAALFVAALSMGAGQRAAAQAAGPPDFTQFGFPQVVGSVDYTPGTTVTVSGGTQQVVLPADFISKTVKFELLQGDASFFSASLPITDQGRSIIVAFAFRVTDASSGQLISRFDKPVLWSVTDPAIAAGSAVFNTTAANPPGITANGTPGTVAGTALSHGFGGAGVGWLVLGPPGAGAATPAPSITALPTALPPSAPTVMPTEVSTAAPTEVPPIAIGMPSTGGGGSPFSAEVALFALLGIAGVGAGLVLKRRRAS